MEENINKEFEEFQKELKIRDKKLKTVVHFEPEKKLDDILDELKNKKINL